PDPTSSSVAAFAFPAGGGSNENPPDGVYCALHSATGIASPILDIERRVTSVSTLAAKQNIAAGPPPLRVLFEGTWTTPGQRRTSFHDPRCTAHWADGPTVIASSTNTAAKPTYQIGLWTNGAGASFQGVLVIETLNVQ